MNCNFLVASADIEQIIKYGEAGKFADWIGFQKFEKEIIDKKNSGMYGTYSEIVEKLYYKVKNDLRKRIIEATILRHN